MQPKLFRPAPAIIQQHFAKGSECGAWTTINNELRIVKQLSATFLEFVHKRILFIGIKRFVEAAQLLQILPPGHQIAKDQFLLAAGPQLADGVITRPAWTKGQPT